MNEKFNQFVAGLVVLDRWSRQKSNRELRRNRNMSLALLYWIDGLDCDTRYEREKPMYVAGLVVLDRWSRPILVNVGKDEPANCRWILLYWIDGLDIFIIVLAFLACSVAGLVVLDRWSRLTAGKATIHRHPGHVAGLVVLDRWSRQTVPPNSKGSGAVRSSLALLYWIDGLDKISGWRTDFINVAGLVVLDRWSRQRPSGSLYFQASQRPKFPSEEFRRILTVQKYSRRGYLFLFYLQNLL